MVRSEADDDCSIISDRSLLQAVLDDSKLSSMEPKVIFAIVFLHMSIHYILFQLAPSLALVLLYDFLLGKGICCGGPLKRMIHKHKATLKETYLEISSKETLTSLEKVATGIADCSIRVF